jgi:hypothetical protein
MIFSEGSIVGNLPDQVNALRDRGWAAKCTSLNDDDRNTDVEPLPGGFGGEHWDTTEGLEPRAPRGP